MDISVIDKPFLSLQDFMSLMKMADKLFTPSLSENIDLVIYSEKLYTHASFVVCSEENAVRGFTAFYKNVDAKQLYVTLICVNKQFQGQGLGSKMLKGLDALKSEGFETIALEVSKTNENAYHLYKKCGFSEKEDKGKKVLMLKEL